ncbi:MAG: type II toxin-antitoxin system RelE family toxin [Gammaproteobacteria bacterium]
MSRVSYRLRAPPQISALIGGLHPRIKKKVRAALEAILSDPHAGKALKDELAGLRSFRIGHFRIVYRISARRVIELVAIGPRERIYEATYRLIAKDPDPGRARD